ncbi:copper resistance CopC/CopD family protein [Microvirga rosea]|uniref:copper resistance CopC/CopD family protein n=1 Tax=Microvirga rosea TaxID=2715425 RepID=UPI001D0A68A4|nr:CopD family protein [Microvirga rosea]MCB8821492.1 CopD family protein [Microvirga rosea]
MTRTVITLLWLAVATLCNCGPVFAHASLIESHPADGVVVQQAPSMVRLRFNEPVSPLAVSLTDARGQTYRDLPVSTSDETLSITMPPDLPHGTHIFSYRVTSGDGHPISGSVTFSVGAPTGSGPSPRVEAETGVRPALWFARVVLYLSLFMGAGGVFFTAWVAADPPKAMGSRHLLEGFLTAGLIAAPLSLGLQGLDALGEPLTALGLPSVWIAGWRTAFGLTAATAVAALLVAWLGLHARSEEVRRGLCLAALSGIGLSLALSGHASNAAPQWLTRPAVFIHAVCVAYWIGALIPLVLVVRRKSAQALPIVRRFSAGALVAVAFLTLTGLILAWIQVGAPANLAGTAYGQLLIAKMALVAGLLGLAALNRRWLTPALAAPGGPAGSRLARSVATEIVLATAILALVGLWRFTPPPRALARATEVAAAASVHLRSSRVMAQVTLAPGRAGPASGKVVIASERATPLNPREVTLILAKPEAGIEPIERKARNTGRDGWQVDGLVLPLPGPWKIKVDVLIDDFEKASLEGNITIRP